MRDTGGKSARRPGRHLQVEASGPGNAATVQRRLAGRFGGKFEAEGGRAGPGGKVDAPELSSGPVCEIQEVRRLGAQGVTSKSKLLAREMPRVCSEAWTAGARADAATWRCGCGMWVGWLPLPFHRRRQVASPTLGRGGYHGCALWPTKSRLQPQGSVAQACRMRALVRDDSACIERG